MRKGGPQVNNPQLLAAGVVDFNVGASSFAALNYIKAKVPMVTVAAIFQKDPQVLLAHPGQGNDTLASLKGQPILAPAARLHPSVVPSASEGPGGWAALNPFASTGSEPPTPRFLAHARNDGSSGIARKSRTHSWATPHGIVPQATTDDFKPSLLRFGR